MTVEASIVFPAIFLALLGMLMFSLYVYQQVIVYAAASVTAERAVFRWDNSSRNQASGMGVTGRYDGLYWRMAGNGALQSLFAMGEEGEGSETIDIGVKPESPGDGKAPPLPAKKMLQAASRVPSSLEGRMRYSYGLLQKKIEVELREPISAPFLFALHGRTEPSSAAAAVIVDPVEWIRNVDLVRYYSAKLKRDPDAGRTRAQAAKVLAGKRTAKENTE